MKIYSQLLNFQNKLRKVSKDAEGYTYNYASFDNVVNTISSELQSQGLGFTHTFDGQDIICTLFNAEGDAITSKLTLPTEILKGMNASQSMGAAITYARRYTLTAILGLVTDEDTDTVASTPPTNQNSSQGQNTVNNAQPPQDDKQWFNLYTRDNKKIPDNFMLVQRIIDSGAESAKQVVIGLGKKGYKCSKAVFASIEKMFEPVVQDDDINLEEIPFD